MVLVMARGCSDRRLAAVSAYLVTAHKEHLAVILPFSFFLACPLMHIFRARPSW